MEYLAQLPIAEASQASEARRLAVHFARRLGFNETQAGNVAIVTTEAANNLAKHAQSGELLLSTFKSSLNILSIDRGPGMDVELCLRDGYSSAGTAGTGLGAIQRLSDRFDAYSSSAGTVISARMGQGMDRVGSAQAPKKGETVCGDAWTMIERSGAYWIMMVDGLGHGELAAAASQQAARVFESSRMDTAARVIEEIHAGMRSTRGAAVAVAEIRGDVIRYCGLGNIASTILSAGKSSQMVSQPGTAGAEARKISEFTYSWNAASTLVMHSDGLQTQWNLERYPGILRRSPSVIAGALYRDFSRGRDDVSVLVVRR